MSVEGDGKPESPRKSRLDLKNPDHRKALARMLIGGYTRKEIAKQWGFKEGSMGLILKRAGGAEKIISETLGPNAVNEYEKNREEKMLEKVVTAARSMHEESLLSDVAADVSVTPHDRFDELRGRQKPWLNRERLFSTPKHTRYSPAKLEKYKNQVLRMIRRAAENGRNSERVERLIGSLIQTLHDDKPMQSDAPVFVSSYIRTSTGSFPEERVLVLRVKRLWKSEVAQAGGLATMVDEFIGALYREVERAQESDSALGNALRSRGFKRVELQTMFGIQPVELSARQLS